MKVGMITSYASRNAGGLYFSVRELSRSIKSLGVDLRVFAYDDQHTIEDIHAWSNLDVRLMKAIKLCGVHFGGDVLQQIADYDADITHVHGLWLMSSWSHLRWGRSSKKPYLIAPRGMLDPWALRNSSWKKKMVGTLFEYEHLRDCSCLHALCESEAKSMRDFGLKNPIAIIPNGINLPPLSTHVYEKPWEGDERRALLFLGRIHPKKGLPLLLAAWADLKRQNPTIVNDWFLAIAGWSEIGHREELEKQAQALGISEDVRFLGSLYGDQKSAALSNASAYILPSYSEGLPMAVLEAWSYHLPSLITPECNLPESFSADASLRIETSVESICSGLHELFAMSDLDRSALGQRAHDLVRRQFTWGRIGEQTEAVYRWMLSGGDAPGCVEQYD